MANYVDEYPPGLEEQLNNLVSRPEIVGYYSVDERRNYLPDFSNMMYYKPPKAKNVQFDLNEGMESAIHRSPSNIGRIDHLLEWVKLNRPDIQRPEIKSWEKPNFICSSGVLVSLMTFQYNSNCGWIICAAKWKGIIYLCSTQSPEQREAEIEMPQKFVFWGKKFDQYLSSEDPDKDPDTSKPVSTTAEFRCVLKRRFGNHTLLFTAVMDALDFKIKLKDPLPLKDLRFVEFKTNRILSTYRQERHRQKYRLPRWWAQGFIDGNEKIVCGFRNDEGIVSYLKTYSLQEIHNLSKDYLDPVSCVKKCQTFLDHVANTVVDDCDKTIYKFRQKPESPDVITEELSPESEYAFMPLSYLTAMS